MGVGFEMGEAVGLVVLALVLGGAGVAWWLYRSLDAVLASAIRTYVPPIVGVSVQLAGVTLQAADGLASINGLVLGNPKGFHTPHAIAVGHIRMQLDVASLTKDVIVVREIRIEQPEVTYEYASGGSNLEVIQRQVEAYIADHATAKNPSAKEGPGKKLIIDHFVIQGAKARVSADMLRGNAVSVALADVHLTDMGKKAQGITPAEAARQVVGALTQSASQAVAPLRLGNSVVEGVKKGAVSATDAVKSLFK